MECYNAALDLLLYVHSTKDLKLNFPGKCEIPKGIDPSMHSKITNNGGLLAYSDASWHKPNEIGYDMFGYNVYLMGGLISFASKNLKVVALSSAEAENPSHPSFEWEGRKLVRVLYDEAISRGEL